MTRTTKIVAGGAALLVAAAAGGAIGATKLTPRQESQAVINDAAGELGVEPDELSNALKQALKNRVDAAVEDGRLTKEQGQRIKERIDANEVPLFGLGPKLHRHHGPGPFHAKFEAAAKYLGMTLAQVARDRDKSVEGLIDALVNDAEQHLEDDVKAGRLTEAEKTEMLSGLRERITAIVNGRFPALRRGFRHGEHRAHSRPDWF
jgi:hypothetical protein